MRVDETSRDETIRAIVFVRHRLHQLPRLVAVLAAPCDLLPVADHSRVLDHSGGGAGEEPPDVAKPPHLLTTVSPPTTTLATSRPEKP